MHIFGLTGNIGCGKSTVAKLFGEYADVLTLDCDRIAKEILQNTAHKTEITRILGETAFCNGNADLKEIARIIFTQPEKKKLLESIIHPLVWATVHERAVSAGPDKICIVESAIIFETQNEDMFTSIITATCNQEEQLRRLREHRNMSIEEIKVRIDQQLPSLEKENRAQFVIQTDCDIQQLRERVKDVHQKLSLTIKQ